MPVFGSFGNYRHPMESIQRLAYHHLTAFRNIHRRHTQYKPIYTVHTSYTIDNELLMSACFWQNDRVMVAGARAVL